MLSDLDELLNLHGIDTVIVPMHEAMHASFRWLSRGAVVTRGYAIKRRGQTPFLVTYPMEREEAAASGLQVLLTHEFDYETIFRESPRPSVAYAEFFGRVLRSIGAGPSVAFFGNVPVPLYLGIAAAMRSAGWEVLEANDEDLIQRARKRKEDREIEAIRSVGERTEQVVDGVRRILRQSEIDGSTLRHQGERLRLRTLKEFVSTEIARLGMVEDHETILSQGSDAGVPHSRGNPDALVEASSPIVLDIFPRDASTGYFFDLTRTFCVGGVPDTLGKLHADVQTAFERARDEMKPGTFASSYQALVCDFFEAQGYTTQRSNPKALEGYVHSLGHGVGLDIHERPFFSLNPSNQDQIEEGDIVTIEPGLYFPQQGLGVRIEDTFVVHAGGVETLCRGDYGLAP